MVCFTLLQTYKVLKRIFLLCPVFCRFTLLQTYKVLKHCICRFCLCFSFTLLQTYKVLKHIVLPPKILFSFTLLQTYKVLKHIEKFFSPFFSFTLLQTYKVLKRVWVTAYAQRVLHSYKLTRFSNYRLCGQTEVGFYTLTNLQGSQTSNEIITEPKHTGNMCKPFSNV